MGIEFSDLGTWARCFEATLGLVGLCLVRIGFPGIVVGWWVSSWVGSGVGIEISGSGAWARSGVGIEFSGLMAW